MSIDSIAVFATSRLSSAYRSRPSTTAFLTALLAAPLLAACSKGVPLRSDDQTRMVPLEQAFALPQAGGPAVTAVLETRYSNATQQDVLLANAAATSGQNMLRVQIFGPVERDLASGESIRPGYLAARDVKAEMRELFPGVRMQTSGFYVQNRYGPFGYAVGRSNAGDTCFYGWQRITSTGFAQTWIGNKGSIQVRLRLCDQDGSEQRLLQSMYGYTINASFKDGNWNPFGEPLPPDEALGRPGAPMYPVSASRFETVTEQVAETPPRRRPAARDRDAAVAAQPVARPAAQPARLPAPTGPAVPPPPGSEASVVPAASAGAPSGAQAMRMQAPAAPAGAAPLVPPPPCLSGGAQTRCN